jgi:F0F1-type ATP synthase epsilon subunit
MSGHEVRFVADGQERLEEVSRRAIEQEVRARFAKEIAHAGLFDRMRIEAKIQKEIRIALDRSAPVEALY